MLREHLETAFVYGCRLRRQHMSKGTATPDISPWLTVAALAENAAARGDRDPAPLQGGHGGSFRHHGA